MSESVLALSWRRPVAFALAVALFAGPAATASGAPSEVVSGPAMAVDGDTLDVSGARVRLEGIDAPEVSQTCPRAWLGTWDCGRAAKRAMEDMVRGQDVTCESRGHDKYDRMLGVCFAAGRNVNAAMVRAGLAWAFVKYSDTYVAEEAEARAARAGIWAAEAEPAWLYRERRWASANGAAPNGCAIKGNVTERGRIYHLPWSTWYGKVKVEPAKGERWFCSEADAAAAGFRPAIVN
jgi:endonuclease YncB( thermonuclease family)